MINIFYLLIVSFVIQIIFFIPAFKYKTDKLTDLTYGLTFILLSLTALLLNSISTFKIILFIMITGWALRLAIFLFIRVNKLKKDSRFDGMRENFRRFSKFWFFQGLTVWIILIPSFFFFNSNTNISTISIIGLLIFVVGLLIESIADAQKYKFKNNPKNTGRFIDTGIWKYSRHPNYFGEMLTWIGIYFFTFSSLNLTSKLIGLISPIYIIFILLFISGIPMLEKSYNKRYKGDKKYEEYKRKTSILIPWPKK
jgi:steroid 5-alpha reductase family enzyme